MRTKLSIKHHIYALVLCALLLSIGIGYAILQKTLSISGTTTVSKNSWDIHFENIVIDTNSVTATSPATIDESRTGVAFTADLDRPGDYYEFTVDVINTGTINAKVDSLVPTQLTDEQLKYLDFTVTYSDGGIISKNDKLPANGGKETLRVVLRFKKEPVEIPTVTTLTVEAKLNFVQDDGSGIERSKLMLYNVLKDNAVMDNIASTYVTSPTGINLGKISSDTNGKGVYTLASTANDANPVYYYRGDVKNNNVEFGGFCWKMIRTTDTGGVKLIYNGTRQENGCTETGDNSSIGTSAYNSKSADIKYVGYTYDKDTTDTIFTTMGNGQKSATQVDSTIKKEIDTWYASNLVTYAKQLEDTPFYNERDYQTSTSDSSYKYFAPRVRIYGSSSSTSDTSNTTIKLSATNTEDVYSVSITKGNGLLQYPIGLLTSDEALLSGVLTYNKSNYLYTGSTYWLLSPILYSNNAVVSTIYSNGAFGIADESYREYGVRPVISLKSGTRFSEGDGTTGNPYKIVTS